MDWSAGTEIIGGGGVVNVQFGIGPSEKFLIRRKGNPDGGPAKPNRGTVRIYCFQVVVF